MLVIMADAAPAFSDELGTLARPKRSLVAELAPTARHLRRVVEHEWDSFTEPQRDMFRAFANVVLEPQRAGWHYMVMGILTACWMLIANRVQFLVYAAETKMLVDAILDADERTNAEYRSDIEGALRSPRSKEPMTAEDFRQWLLNNTK